MSERPAADYHDEPKGSKKYLIGREATVLDHGFIKVIDIMGDDAAIVQAARVSYGKGTKSVSEDAALINRLLRLEHTTPFEMCEMKLLVRLPIFVARQWIRHRTANVNEYSARYSEVKDVYYVPELAQILPQSKTDKQGRSTTERLTDEVKEECRQNIIRASKDAYEKYQMMLDYNVSREVARIVLPLNFYTEWYWKVDTKNLLHFLFLRCDSHAQYEIRVYADAIAELIKEWLPQTYAAFENYKLDAIKFSKAEQHFLAQALDYDTVDRLRHLDPPDNMSKQEWNEFLAKLKNMDKAANYVG